MSLDSSRDRFTESSPSVDTCRASSQCAAPLGSLPRLVRSDRHVPKPRVIRPRRASGRRSPSVPWPPSRLDRLRRALARNACCEGQR
jgi:hypothetical protein